MKTGKVKQYLPKVCFLAMTLFACAGVLMAANNQQNTSQFYGACTCGSSLICQGVSIPCDDAICATVGAVCGTKTVIYPTSTCVSGSSAGSCNAGSSYTCWEQFHCLCKDNWWPWPNTCSNTGSRTNFGTTIRKSCV